MRNAHVLILIYVPSSGQVCTSRRHSHSPYEIEHVGPPNARRAKPYPCCVRCSRRASFAALLALFCLLNPFPPSSLSLHVWIEANVMEEASCLTAGSTDGPCTHLHFVFVLAVQGQVQTCCLNGMSFRAAAQSVKLPGLDKDRKWPTGQGNSRRHRLAFRLRLRAVVGGSPT